MDTAGSAPWKKTACILCSVNCGLEVQTSGARIVRIRGDRAKPVSQGDLCEKSQRMDHYQNGADRIDAPMRRRADGSYERIDWPTAIREIAAKLKAIRDRHGGDTILYYGGGGQRNGAGSGRRSVGAGKEDGLRRPRRLRALRSGRIRRQEPVAIARLRATA